jgi:hypothetical protein
VTGTPPTKTPTPTPTATPRGPTGLSCSPRSERSVELEWNNPPAPDSENWFEYLVERRVVGGDWPDGHVAAVPAPGNSYVDTNLTVGAAYEYRVRGHRPATSSFSGYSNTQACRPFTPTPGVTPPTHTPTPTDTATPEPTVTPTPTDTETPPETPPPAGSGQ